jgi:hypothetical protein
VLNDDARFVRIGSVVSNLKPDNKTELVQVFARQIIALTET